MEHRAWNMEQGIWNMEIDILYNKKGRDKSTSL